MPHPRLLHEALAGTATPSSSSSDSGGAGEGAGRAVAVGFVGRRGTGAGRASERDPNDTGVLDGMSGATWGASTGVSSISVCVPVVQGGIARNSSNVRTRGLQHFQPANKKSA